jgi:hypothetical protein
MKKYLILTYGRAGSVLIAEKIGRAVNSLPIYIKSKNQLENSTVQHSHLTFDKEQIESFVKIFCLRQDPVETILSWIISHHYNQFHRFKQQSYDFEPFEYTNWNQLTALCNGYVQYHNFYCNNLDNQTAILYYEDALQSLPEIDQTYLPIYPNKQRMLINYDQVLENIVSLHADNMLRSQQWCLNVKNQIDLCQEFNW